MPFLINVFNVKTNGVTQNANLDFGGIVQNSHTANSKNIGINFSNGDLSSSASCMANSYFDTSLTDQDQNANPSPPFTSQF
ncbi:spore germination protein [Halobacillus salinarum]|uniref:Spore germination protein n=1 Tax=Halobacillus salinarum TaxID=2932257 RepID=A0ABY4EM53_9BACI|nr:spore germination protein [Halobacillus salinarum]UOQ45087.1 spore germination protein [Halobacillus salinarum]